MHSNLLEPLVWCGGSRHSSISLFFPSKNLYHPFNLMPFQQPHADVLAVKGCVGVPLRIQDRE